MQKKKILTKKLKKLEDIENILKKILTCEKEIISWQYNYTEDAKGEILSDIKKKRIEDANINIIRLKKELDNFKLRLIELETSDDVINFNL